MLKQSKSLTRLKHKNVCKKNTHGCENPDNLSSPRRRQDAVVSVTTPPRPPHHRPPLTSLPHQTPSARLPPRPSSLTAAADGFSFMTQLEMHTLSKRLCPRWGRRRVGERGSGGEQRLHKREWGKKKGGEREIERWGHRHWEKRPEREVERKVEMTMRSLRWWVSMQAGRRAGGRAGAREPSEKPAAARREYQEAGWRGGILDWRTSPAPLRRPPGESQGSDGAERGQRQGKRNERLTFAARDTAATATSAWRRALLGRKQILAYPPALPPSSSPGAFAPTALLHWTLTLCFALRCTVSSARD